MKNLCLISTVLISISLSCTNNKISSVHGHLCYPSEYIPRLTIYLQNKNTQEILKLVTANNDSIFEFKNVPDGEYIAYAYTIDSCSIDPNTNIKSKCCGGYSKAVPCGLSVNCLDQNLIIFKVKNGGCKDDIRICDWYSDIEKFVPKE